MNTDNGRESYSLGLDINQMLRDARRAENAFQSIGNKAVSEGEKIDKTFRTIGAGIASYFAVEKIMEFGKAIIDARGEIESFQISFDTLIGDKEKASAFFGELKDFAVNTPLLLNDLAKGGQLLLGFGVDADKVMPTLKQIGDISMGNAERFNSLALAFAQMSATGKLVGQDLLQMVNAGFNPLQVMSQKTGKSMATLKDEMSKGAISSEMVAQAFEDATAKGGKFNGMLEKQSKGIKGSISNLEGAIQDALNDMGEKGQDIITEGISLATTAVKNYEKLGAILAGMIVTYGMYRTAVMFAIEAEKGYTIAQTLNIKALLIAEKAQKLLNKTMLANPYVLAAVALGVVITSLLAFRDTTSAAEKAQDNYNKKNKGCKR
ncbi:tape measure protein [Bacteroides fragilis]